MMTEMITVCDSCLKASCWQGIFMCDNSMISGTLEKKKSELLELELEHQDYMKTDDELWCEK